MSEPAAVFPVTSAPERFDVVIIGGGLVGASLACALAPLMNGPQEDGLRVAVVEANPLPPAEDTGRFQPSFDARASAIAAGSRQRFIAFGLWEAMREHATPIRTIHVSERGHIRGHTHAGRGTGGSRAGAMWIPNAWMGHVLHRRLAELPLTWYCPARVAQISVSAQGHRLLLEDGRLIEAGLTVLADGGRIGAQGASRHP